jgi:hypothetical protein
MAYTSPVVSLPVRSPARVYLEVQVDFVGPAEEVAAILEEGPPGTREAYVQGVPGVLLHRAVVVRLHGIQADEDPSRADAWMQEESSFATKAYQTHTYNSYTKVEGMSGAPGRRLAEQCLEPGQ